MELTSGWWNPTRAFNHLLLSPTLIRRGIAMLLDLAIVSALQVGLSQVFGVYHLFPDGATSSVINGDGFSFSSSWYATMPYLWLALIIVAYFTIFEALFGATPGKGLLRLRVVGLDGRRPSFGAILIRNIFRLIDALPFLYIVGGLVAQNTANAQRVGDILANTSVISLEPRRADDAAIRRGALRVLLLSMLLAAMLGGTLAFEYYGRGPLVIQSWINMNNHYGSSASSIPVCGPLRRAPFANAPAASALNLDTPGSIIQYAVGAPRWGSGSVTYPIRVQVWNSRRDSGYLAGEPLPESMAAMPSGPDVYNGSVTLRWAGPLTGGWVMQSGQISC